MTIEGFQDIKVGDLFEIYLKEKVVREKAMTRRA